MKSSQALLAALLFLSFAILGFLVYDAQYQGPLDKIPHIPFYASETQKSEPPKPDEQLRRALRERDWSLVQALITKHTELAKLRVHGQMAPLHHAALYNQLELAKHCLRHGADPNAESEYGTPLHNAAAKAEIEIVKLLLDNGADTSTRSLWNTPLHRAVENKGADIVDLLLKAGADPDAIGQNRRTSLHKAAQYGNLKAAKRFLELKANVNAKDRFGWTPLHVAQYKPKMIKFLIEHGADVHAMTADGKTPLHLEVSREGAGYLVEQGAKVNVRAADGSTPLHAATQFNHPDVIELLLDKGADPNARMTNGKTPLHREAESSYQTERRIQALLDKGAKLDMLDRNGRTPLHAAATGRGNLETIRFLLNAGAAVNPKNKAGSTPLDLAIMRKTRDDNLWPAQTRLMQSPEKGRGSSSPKPPVDILIDRGGKLSPLARSNAELFVALDPWDRGEYPSCVDLGHWNPAKVDIAKIKRLITTHPSLVNATSFQLQRPLHAAVGANHFEAVKFLVDNGADVDSRNYDGSTPLHGAVEYLITGQMRMPMRSIDIKLTRFLLDHGADVNAVNNNGETPLHIAVSNGYLEHAKLLLKAGSTVTVRDKAGATLFHAACGNRHPETAEWLIALGADMNARDLSGRTPLQHAVDRNNASVLKTLLAYGAKIDVLNQWGLTPLEEARLRGHLDLLPLLHKKAEKS